MNNKYFLVVFSVSIVLLLAQPVFAEDLTDTGTGSVLDSFERESEERQSEVSPVEGVNEGNENDEAIIDDDAVPSDQETMPNPVEEDVLPFESGTSFFVLFLQMIASLVVVVALIYIILRFFGKKSRSFTELQAMQNIGGVPLGTNRSIQMIKVSDNRILIVGVGETIQLIKEIDDPEEIEKIVHQQGSEFERLEQPITKATQWVGNLFNKNSDAKSKEKLEFSELLNKQLDDVSKSQQKIHEAMKEHSK